MDVSFTYGNFGVRPAVPEPGRYADRDAEIVRLAKEGATVRDVADKLGMTISNVYKIARGHWQGKPGRKGNQERDAEIVRLAKSGMTIRDVAAQCGVSLTWAFRVGRGHWHGTRGVSLSAKAERNAEIIRLAESGMTIEELSAKFGLGKKRIYAIARHVLKLAHAPHSHAERNAEIIRLAESGMRAKQIAAKVGLSWMYVSHIARGHFASGQCQNDAERDAEICRRIIDDGRLLREVGEEYGITRERVRQIVRRSHPEFSRSDIIHAKSVARLARIEKEKYERKASREALITEAKALIAGGMSKSAAFRQLGLGEGRLFDALKGVSVNHGRWRPAIAELRANLAEHVAAQMTNTAIAIKYGVSTHCVASTRKRLGLPPARSKG